MATHKSIQAAILGTDKTDVSPRDLLQQIAISSFQVQASYVPKAVEGNPLQIFIDSYQDIFAYLSYAFRRLDLEETPQRIMLRTVLVDMVKYVYWHLDKQEGEADSLHPKHNFWRVYQENRGNIARINGKEMKIRLDK